MNKKMFNHNLEYNAQSAFLFIGWSDLTLGTDLFLGLVAFSWPPSKMTGAFICFSTTSNLPHMCFLPACAHRHSGGICIAHHLRLSQNSSAVTLKRGHSGGPVSLLALAPGPRAVITLIERRDQIE